MCIRSQALQIVCLKRFLFSWAVFRWTRSSAYQQIIQVETEKLNVLPSALYIFQITSMCSNRRSFLDIVQCSCTRVQLQQPNYYADRVIFFSFLFWFRFHLCSISFSTSVQPSSVQYI